MNGSRSLPAPDTEFRWWSTFITRSELSTGLVAWMLPTLEPSNLVSWSSPSYSLLVDALCKPDRLVLLPPLVLVGILDLEILDTNPLSSLARDIFLVEDLIILLVRPSLWDLLRFGMLSEFFPALLSFLASSIALSYSHFWSFSAWS